MKKNIIAILIGTLIIFAWQSVSWMATPIHTDTLKYTPQQDAIMEELNNSLSAPGFYAVPGHDHSKEMTMEEMQAANESMLHKPWALVLYNDSFEGMNAGNMIAGLLTNMAAVIIAVVLLNVARARERSFGAVFGVVMMLPLFCIFQAVLENTIWWGFPWHFIKGTIFDLLIAWTLCGLYFGWYFGKRRVAAM